MWHMVMEFSSIMRVKSMKDSGKRTSLTEKVEKHGKMVVLMKVNIKRVLKMALEFTICQVEMSIKVTGKVTKSMEREDCR